MASQTGTLTQTAVAAGATFVLFGPNNVDGSARLYALVTSTLTFDIITEISTDSGVTWIKAKKVSAAAGPDSVYVKAAELDTYVPSYVRVSVKNTDASAADYVYDVRWFKSGTA
jgi:hypothetical protein